MLEPGGGALRARVQRIAQPGRHRTKQRLNGNGALAALHLLCACVLLSIAPAVLGETVLVAVATNFAPVLDDLAPGFAAETGHRLERSSGATGQLYAQIVNGAPFDVFMAADDERPRRLAEAGLGVAESRFTYARGQLALWAPRAPELLAHGLEHAVASDAWRRIAIANPAVAPYGLAAQQTLEQLGRWTPLGARLVRGENIGQAYAIVATGNAELGLVAWSQVLAEPAAHVLRVPESLHAPIRQDAILLTRAAANPAAIAWMTYLRSSAARTLITESGYATDADRPPAGR
jgi:molybdate transport system substrate-binding protein